jgi:opacity protein-like surface antigen
MIERLATRLAMLLLATVTALPVSAQQRPESPQEVEARLARQGAGLLFGTWNVQGVERSGVQASTWPFVDGYFQRGMDRHLAIESTAGLWRRQETETRSGLGGQTTTERTTYIVPLLTGLKFYPTAPGSRLEPFVSGAVGFALGIEDNQGGGGGILGGGSGTRVDTGFGFRGAGGVEFALSPAFGLAAGAGYQWIRFGSPVGATDTYRGIRATGGLTYRFQY